MGAASTRLCRVAPHKRSFIDWPVNSWSNLLASDNTDVCSDHSLLIVDDDELCLRHYSDSLQKFGFEVSVASSVLDAKRIIAAGPPAYTVTELRLPDGNGLDIVEALSRARSDCKIIVLTRFGTFATAAAAIRIGAIDYLVKPIDCSCVKDALLAVGKSKPLPPVNPVDPDRARWQHILRVHELCGYNVSETARKLSMHRRSLQRIIQREAERSGSSSQKWLEKRQSRTSKKRSR